MKKIYTLETFSQELAKRFPNNEIKILNFQGACKYIKYQCVTCGKIYEKNRANHLYENKTLCQKCYSPKNSKIRNWINDFFKQSQQFVLINWTGCTSDYLIIKCNSCLNIFQKKPGNMYLREEKTICPICGKNGAPTPEFTFSQMMLDNGYKNYKIIKYESLRKNVTLQHQCGYTFSQIACNFLKSRGCPRCAGVKSKGELKLENILSELKINFIPQYHPQQELSLYSFDFYLPDLNVMIEYQGEQHYRPVSIYGGESKFLQQKKRDDEKRFFCKKHHYFLLEIPYTDYNILNKTYLINLLSSTTGRIDVASSEAKEKTSKDDGIVCSYMKI